MHQMCKENSLGAEQEETLKMMVEKMYKLYNEPHVMVIEEKSSPDVIFLKFLLTFSACTKGSQSTNYTLKEESSISSKC